MPAKKERCVQAVIEQGYTEQQAWAICTASIGDENGCKKVNDVSMPAFDKYIDESTGFLHVKGRIARTGVQEYLGRELSPDLDPGRLYGVLRHPEDVLAESSMSGFRNSPVTDDHPMDFVTSENYKDLMKGTCSDIVTSKEDGIAYIDGHLTIMDGELVRKLKDGKLEISAGYYSDLEEEEGEYLGVPYHYRQKNITPNHVAIVSRGRCGGGCRILNDEKNVTITDENQNEGVEMAKIVIGEVEYEVPEEVAMEFQKLTEALSGKEEEVTTMSEDMEEIEKEKEKAVATADELKEQIRSLKRTTKDSAIATEAGKIVKVMQIADSMGIKVEMSDEATMKKAILKAKYPTIDLDGKSADYITARFDAMTEGQDAAKKSHQRIADENKDGLHDNKKLADSLKDEEY